MTWELAVSCRLLLTLLKLLLLIELYEKPAACSPSPGRADCRLQLVLPQVEGVQKRCSFYCDSRFKYDSDVNGIYILNS